MLIPYVSPQEFADAPTGLNLDNLVPKGTPADQSAQLVRILQRATAWIDNYCQMQLRATVNTEEKRVWVTKDGWLTVFPDFSPIQAVTAAAWKAYPAQEWVPLDLQHLEVFPRKWRWAGPGIGFYAGAPVSVRYTYVNGWPVTVLTSAVQAGATSLTLDNAVGIVPGALMTVYDGAVTEQVTVQSVSGNSIVLASPVASAHPAGVHVSSLPDDVRQACILVAARFVKQRRSGGAIMVDNMGRMRPSLSESDVYQELQEAQNILRTYRRVI